jgi:CheY-like chemotaxis protein
MSKGIKILIVEDDENLRFLVVHRLHAEGYEVFEVGDGEVAEQSILTESQTSFCWTGCFLAKKGLRFVKVSASRDLRV